MMIRTVGVPLALVAALGAFGVASAATNTPSSPPAPGPSAVVTTVVVAPAPSPSSQPVAQTPVVIPPVTPPPGGAPSLPSGGAPSVVPPVVLPQAERGPYLGTDGAYHFPADGRAQVPTLSCVPLFICDVTLEEGESILNVATGDSARWLIASASSGPGGDIPHVLIKPTTLGLRTNLVITTTRRVYYVLLQSTPTTPYSRLTYFYPDDEAAAAAALAAQDRQRELAREAELPLRPVGPLDVNFRMYGDTALLPYKVYADQTHTWIEYSKTPVDLPVVYEVSPDGADQIVNYRFKDGIFIIDGVPRDMDLVLNAGTGRGWRGERRVHIRHN